MVCWTSRVRGRRARSVTRRVERVVRHYLGECARPMRRTGARARWPSAAGLVRARSAASGGPLRCSRTGSRASSSPRTRCSLRKCATSSGLYLHPPDRALVLCVDEKAQIQALDRSQPLLPMRPGQAERRTPDYVRHGTINLFAALDVKAGTVIGEFHRRHRTAEFRSFLETIDSAVPDKLRTAPDSRQLRYSQDPGHQALVAAPSTLPSPLHPHWCAPGLIWSSAGLRCLRKNNCAGASIAAPTNCKDAIRAYLEHNNRHPKPFIWTKTADQILDSVARFCNRISDSGH